MEYDFAEKAWEQAFSNNQITFNIDRVNEES
jgi:hypothetical protein